MMFDYCDLRGRIISKFGSIKAFAKAYGISFVSMSRKLNGRTAITQDDVIRMSAPDMLDIMPCEYGRYFFTLKVHAM